MNEITTIRKYGRVRWQLLATASTMTLLSLTSPLIAATDNSADDPQVWIELGGQLNRLETSEEAFSPPIMADRPAILSPSAPFEKPPLHSIDETGKIEFQPRGTDWRFTASILYGHSERKQDELQQTHPAPYQNHLGTYVIGTIFPTAQRFAETNEENRSSHFILDFQAGKDVGLGFFGGTKSDSTLNLGVRFAQFNSKSNITLNSDPDWQHVYEYFGPYKIAILQGHYHSHIAKLESSRSFHGVGPSVSWNTSLVLVGNPARGEIGLDGGINASVLFGRQRMQESHHTTGKSQPGNFDDPPLVTYLTANGHARSHFVTVPNLGGFAGLSFSYPNAKISFGYRGDFFFGAMDGGIDTAKKENVGFYGPFASISVGVGG